MLSPNLEPLPERAELFWVYGCPNGDTVLPTLRWIKRALPFWNASVRERAPRRATATHLRLTRAPPSADGSPGPNVR